MTSTPRRLWIGTVIVLVAALAPTSVTPASYLSPTRPLSEAELLLGTAERADAVVVVEVASTELEFFRQRGARDAGALVSIVEGTVIRSLKGPLRRRSGLRIQQSQRSPEAVRGGTYLVFLRSFPVRKAEYAASRRGSLPAWTILSSPFDWSLGMRQVPAGQIGPDEGRTAAALRLLEPRALAATSDLVVVGRRLRGKACPQPDRSCQVVEIERHLYGERTGSTIEVETPMPWLLIERSLLYLRHVAGNRFAVVGGTAGAQKIDGEGVGSGGRPRVPVLQAIELAERKRAVEARRH